MKLLDDIIAGAVDGQQPIADVLRKCLVLAFQLKNDRLKEWVEKELNGFFERRDALPDYREAAVHSKGNFQGGGDSWLPSRPLPLSNLDKKHQAYVRTFRFVQPIASLDTGGKTDEAHNAIVNWPPDVIVQYQGKFIRGYALVQAWQELPASCCNTLVWTTDKSILQQLRLFFGLLTCCLLEAFRKAKGTFGGFPVMSSAIKI